jgi:hypothetical protein
VPARAPGGKLKIIEDAPGSYASLRLDTPQPEKAKKAAPSAPARRKGG